MIWPDVDDPSRTPASHLPAKPADRSAGWSDPRSCLSSVPGAHASLFLFFVLSQNERPAITRKSAAPAAPIYWVMAAEFQGKEDEVAVWPDEADAVGTAVAVEAEVLKADGDDTDEEEEENDKEDDGALLVVVPVVVSEILAIDLRAWRGSGYVDADRMAPDSLLRTRGDRGAWEKLKNPKGQVGPSHVRVEDGQPPVVLDEMK